MRKDTVQKYFESYFMNKALEAKTYKSGRSSNRIRSSLKHVKIVPIESIHENRSFFTVDYPIKRCVFEKKLKLFDLNDHFFSFFLKIASIFGKQRFIQLRGQPLGHQSTTPALGMKKRKNFETK